MGPTPIYLPRVKGWNAWTVLTLTQNYCSITNDLLHKFLCIKRYITILMEERKQVCSLYNRFK